jgi:hypothetical protein
MHYGELMYVCMFHLQNYRTDLDENWYFEVYTNSHWVNIILGHIIPVKHL